jgi:hypothetical protein
MAHLHFHFLPILVSALILWFLGAIWYSPVLFAKPWAAMVGIKMDGSAKKSMVPGMISSFIGDLILALMLAHFIVWSGANTIHRGAFIGLITWLGFIAAPAFPQGIYEGRPFKLFAINTGYWLVGLIGVGILLAVWQ